MKVKKRTSKLSGNKTHPVLIEKLTLDVLILCLFDITCPFSRACLTRGTVLWICESRSERVCE